MCPDATYNADPERVKREGFRFVTDIFQTCHKCGAVTHAKAADGNYSAMALRWKRIWDGRVFIHKPDLYKKAGMPFADPWLRQRLHEPHRRHTEKLPPTWRDHPRHS